jgi:hypothetical protein
LTKEEFSEIINFFNKAKKSLSVFDYNILTVEQIERLLKEVNNQIYVDKKNILSILMVKKYNKLIKKAQNKNDLDELKKILYELCNLFKEYSPEYVPGILLYILKINKKKNIMDIEPFKEYIKNPIIDKVFYEQRNFYSNKISNSCSNSLINIPLIDFNEINKHKFIEELLIDFFIFNKAKREDFNKYFK